GNRRRTAFADAVVDLELGDLRAGGVEHARAQRHRAAAVTAVSRLLAVAHLASVEPDEPEPSARRLEQRREPVLRLRAVVMRRDGRRPRLAAVAGEREAYVVGVGTGAALLEPVRRKRS